MYTHDVRSRLSQLKAAATSVYGRIIKIDSTKKICRKLAGAAVGTATWQTNVGNEKGEVLLSVVTDSEALVSLQPMANGLMKRTNRCLSKIGVLCISIFILDTEMQDKIHR